jgi:hypothetical protein
MCPHVSPLFSDSVCTFMILFIFQTLAAHSWFSLFFRLWLHIHDSLYFSEIHYSLYFSDSGCTFLILFIFQTLAVYSWLFFRLWLYIHNSLYFSDSVCAFIILFIFQTLDGPTWCLCLLLASISPGYCLLFSTTLSATYMGTFCQVQYSTRIFYKIKLPR